MKAPMAKRVQGICRSIYTVRFPGSVYILHACQKKSKSGSGAPQEDVKLISERLKRAQQDYENRQHHEHPRH
jgi:phage-related protein